MGRMAIIIVIGLSLTVGIVGYSLNSSKSGTIENVSGFDKYTHARNMAHTAVNMALRALDRNDSLFIANRTMSLEMMGGKTAVSIAFPGVSLDTVDVTAESAFMDTSRLMKVRLHRRPIPFPMARQAVGLRIPNPVFELDGSPDIDGHDHRMNGAPLPPSANDVPGVGVMQPEDTSIILPFGSKIDGEPTNIVGDTAIDDPSDYAGEYFNAADKLFTSGTYASNQTWGTAASPWIVACDGDVSFTGVISGYGILVVRGKLTIAGTFKFRGLVLAYDDTQIDVSFSVGTMDIIGGIIAAGDDGSKFSMRGGSKVSYSTEALNMARYINKLQVYRVVRWYE